MRELGRLLTAMVTPFDAGGGVDWEGVEQMAARLVDDGSDGVVVSGTTGESPALSDDEKIELVRVVRAAVPRATVVAGTGSNDTRHSVHLSERAMAAGADALLAVVPYYNKPPQEGMFRHFRAISEAGPTIMYNIQGRTAVNMTAETTLRCAALPGIVGVKEASGSIDQMGFVCAGAPEGFRVWAGDDSFTLPLLAIGGHGVICVTSHLAGRTMRRLIETFEAGDTATARDLHLRLLPVISALMTYAANPVPLKSVLARLGARVGPFRLPLTPLPDADVDRLLAVIEAAGNAITFRRNAGVA